MQAAERTEGSIVCGLLEAQLRTENVRHAQRAGIKGEEPSQIAARSTTSPDARPGGVVIGRLGCAVEIHIAVGIFEKKEQSLFLTAALVTSKSLGQPGWKSEKQTRAYGSSVPRISAARSSPLSFCQLPNSSGS